MCGRFALTLPPDMVSQLFDATIVSPDNAPPLYNICPTQDIRVAISSQEGRRVVKMRWGFIPHWYKTPNDGPLLINARAETIAQKPAFAKAARERRCLIPATGFYEWTKAEDGGRDPWYIHPVDRASFAFAGIWRTWALPEGQRLETVAIVTCEAASDIAHIHHRQPVMIEPDDHALWLGEAGKGAAVLMKPAKIGTLAAHKVARKVNSSRAPDEPSLIEPL